MRIAVLVGMFPKISETFIVNQIIGLIDRRHDVTIIASEAAEEDVQPEVTTYQLLKRTRYPDKLASSKILRVFKFAIDCLCLLLTKPLRAKRSVSLAYPFDSRGMQKFYLAQLFREEDFDIVHCHFGFIGETAARLKDLKLIKAPLITSFHGTDIGARVTTKDLEHIHQHGTHFTANSQFSANRAIDLGCPRERISLLPVGVSLPDFQFSERRLEKSQSLRLLTVARLIEGKGIHIALEAVSQLVEQGLQVHFDVVGDGPERERLERQAKDLNVSGNVTFHGALLKSQVIGLFAQAHLFILPSLSIEKRGMEGQGLVLQEAQAMGLPVIASRCCGIPEGVLDGESGFLVPDGDPTALAQCINQLYHNHVRWPEFGRAGRSLVEERYDIESLNDHLVDLYQSTVAG